MEIEFLWPLMDELFPLKLLQDCLFNFFISRRRRKGTDYAGYNSSACILKEEGLPTSKRIVCSLDSALSRKLGRYRGSDIFISTKMSIQGELCSPAFLDYPQINFY